MTEHFFNFTPKPNALLSRTILISGAGEGIGRAAALGYASLGATVLLLGRTQEKLETLYDEIESSGYPCPMIIPLDLETATESDYQLIADEFGKTFSSLDGLLNNASVLGDLTLLEQYPFATWQQVMQINVNGQFYLTRTLLPFIRNAEQGSIIFTSSSVGRKGRAHWGAYAVSKFATEGMMQTLADELQETTCVRVNSINPGATRTSMRALAYPAEEPTTLRAPSDILGTYYYLMCDDSIGVTGKTFDAQPKRS